MTDMEMLELAAKAIGERLVPFEKLPILDIEGSPFWNPRMDSKDAFDLAARLQVDIRHIGKDADEFPIRNSCVIVTQRNWRGFVAEQHGEDPYAALRLAILRAAAEIGKGMP